MTSKNNSPSKIALQGVTALFVGILWLVNLLPFRVKLAIGKGLGALLYRIPNTRIGITRRNLELCFPDYSDDTRERMVRETFVNFGAGIIESGMGWWDKPAGNFAMTETIGAEHLDRAIEKGKGVLLIGAHFSTLDLSSQLFSKYHQYYAMYREQTNSVLNAVMKKGRLNNMLGAIPHTSMRGAAKQVLNGDIVWYSPDQDMGERHSVFAPFFGHPAATLTATAKLASLTGAPLVMLASYRKPDDSGYVLEFFPGPANFPADDEVESATMVNQLIEQGIMRAPTQYYWFHRRFKTQPNREKSALYQ